MNIRRKHSTFWVGSVLFLILVWKVRAANYVVAWGDNRSGQSSVPQGLTNVVAIAGGTFHSLAVRSDGTVAAWGCCSPQTNVPPGLSGVVSVAAGYLHSVALRSNGTVVSWGLNADGETNVPPGLTNTMAIAAGDYHTVALRSNGTVVAWGYPDSRIAVPANLSNVIAVGASQDNSLALKNDGTLVRWGPTGIGVIPLSSLSNVVAVSGAFLVLLQDGTVVSWGSNSAGQTNVPAGLAGVTAIAGNGSHNLALGNGGNLVAWGDGTWGQTNIPPGITNITRIAVGPTTSLAIVSVLDGSPIITSHPFQLTAFTGESPAFTVSAEGTPPLACQWQFQGTNIPGATNFLLQLTNAQLTNAGSYRAIITNSFGSATSLSASLTVTASPPIVTFQIPNQTVFSGSSVTLSLPIPATGSLPLTYQWRFNNSNIPDATNAALVITNVQPSNEGNYRIFISNPYSSVLTSNAYLTVIDLQGALDNPGLIWSSSGNASWLPQNTVTYNATMGVVARSGAITNNQQSTLETTVIGPATLSFWWQVSSQPIADYLSFSIDGVEQNRISGSSSWIQSTYYLTSGSHTLDWRYSKDGSASAGEDLGRVDQVGVTFGATAPVVAINPMQQAMMPGSNAIFSVSAQGTPPFTYQWQFNNSDITGATNSSLVLTNVQLSDNGNYRLIVHNDAGSATSTNAVLVVFNYVGPQTPQDQIDRWYFRDSSFVTRVEFVGGTFIALGTNGTIRTSPDGKIWTARNSGTTANLNGAAFGSVLPGNKPGFVVVGSGGKILTSSDATNWASVASGTSVDLTDIAFLTDTFVAVTANGPPNALYSWDGQHWYPSSFPSGPSGNRADAIATDGNSFIAVAGPEFADEIWQSYDGYTWTDVGFSDAVIGGIAYGNNRFIMAGWEGWPRVSTNGGASWFASPSSVITPGSFPEVGSDIAFGNGNFLVVRGWLTNGFLTTIDGVTWNSRPIFLGSQIDSVCFGNGTFVISSSGGSYPAGIYQSEAAAIPFFTSTFQPLSNSFTFYISGELGRAYRLRVSSNLTDWTDVCSYTNLAPGTVLVAPIPPGLPRAFYKVVSP
jgi:hypothetical protein